MRKAIVAAVVLAAFQAWPALGDVKDENFLLKNTGDLVALCGVSAKDPKAEEAIHFCHGYVIGLNHFHAVVDKVFEGHVYCTDNRKMPTRNEAIAMIVKYHKANPQYKTEPPIDGVLRWARYAFPCPKNSGVGK